MYILDIEKSLNEKLYASGESGSANRIGFFVSDDNGPRWDTISFISFKNTNPSLKCIALFSDSIVDNLFLGGNGVYLFKNGSVTAIGFHQHATPVSLFPNPSTTGRLSIHISDRNVRIESWLLSEMLGKVVLAGQSHNFTISGQGMYFLTVKTNKGLGEKNNHRKMKVFRFGIGCQTGVSIFVVLIPLLLVAGSGKPDPVFLLISIS